MSHDNALKELLDLSIRNRIALILRAHHIAADGRCTACARRVPDQLLHQADVLLGLFDVQPRVELKP